MVARGDLGVELPPEHVPPLQKQIVEAARRKGRPVVVATQMLESMIDSPSPTRAEVSDVATAIYDGADAVMLSAETAAGKWPIQAVTIMDRIAQQVENDPGYYDRVHYTETPPIRQPPMHWLVRVNESPAPSQLPRLCVSLAAVRPHDALHANGRRCL